MLPFVVLKLQSLLVAPSCPLPRLPAIKNLHSYYKKQGSEFVCLSSHVSAMKCIFLIKLCRMRLQVYVTESRGPPHLFIKTDFLHGG
jgi:hypothetical protein